MGRPFDFTGKVALVTGVGRVGQIGFAVAQALGRGGAQLVLADRNAVELGRRVSEFGAEGIVAHAAAGDLTQADVAHHAVDTAVARFGRLDVVVNVAGGLTGVAPLAETDTGAFDREFELNVKTTFLVSRAAVQPMLEAGRGAIVNFASVAALAAKPQLAAYSAAKAGVAAITRVLAMEVRDLGVRVNAVAPGLVRTRDNVEQLGADGLRWVEIDEIVNGVLFLASDLASGITGHVLPILGGDL